MKKITESFYEIEPELYAEWREGGWVITDEKAAVVAGPFATLELLDASLKPGAEEVKTSQGETVRVVINPPGVTDRGPADLVTLREAAGFLPVTRQALEARKRRGTLKVSPVVVGRSTELYSLRELKEAFPK
jgi:hypothetical protein